MVSSSILVGQFRVLWAKTTVLSAYISVVDTSRKVFPYLDHRMFTGNLRPCNLGSYLDIH